MADYTPNLNLYKPNRLDADIEVDVSLADNFEKVDLKLGETDSKFEEIDEKFTLVQKDVDDIKQNGTGGGSGTGGDMFIDGGTFLDSYTNQTSWIDGGEF